MRIKVVNPVIVTKVDWGPLMEKGYAHAHDADTELDHVLLRGSCGVRMCEMLVKLGLAESKVAYPTPRE